MTRRKHWATALALVAALAACRQDPGSSPTPEPTDDPAAQPEPAPHASSAKSILRPSMAATEKAPLAPISRTITFGFQANGLDDSARSTLDQLLETEELQAGGRITLRGHSDSRGSDEDNRRASIKRAETVRDYLIEHGVDKARITVIGLGEDRPLEPNSLADGSDNPAGRARNRRVEIAVSIPEPKLPVDDSTQIPVSEEAKSPSSAPPASTPS
ncbi:outer membrane protein OmpA-like peptidoglycan-associated protein [Porphyrobacter sp. MBR-155]|jgi:OOP family OmpA-OmpF porin